MKKEAFELLREAEQSWWYRGRALVIRAMLTRARIVAPLDPILDFGAGFGGMYSELSRLSSDVYASEPDADARTVAAMRGYVSTYATDAEALSKHYGLIGLFDVIEHIEDDKAFLLSLREALTPEGVLAITVPAFQFLWNEHDVVHQHFRRYNKRSLFRLLSDTGYESVTMSYWNTFLFIPAAAVRLLGRSGSSALGFSGFINTLVLVIVTIESKVLRFCSLPFGISLVVIARKKNSVPTPEK